MERIDRRAGVALVELRRARRAAAKNATPVETARVPPTRNAPRCSRDNDGVITSNQSISCDVSLLGGSLRALFGESS